MLCLKVSSVVLLLILTAVPVVHLLIGSVDAAFNGVIPNNPITAELFLNSVLLNFSAAGLSVLLGFLVAIGVWVFIERYAARISVAIMLLILLPPFIHVQSWIYFVDKLNNIFGQIFGVTPNFTGIFAVVLTLAISYMPITAGLCLVALLSVSPEISDQCMLEGSGKAAFLKIYIPSICPALCIGGLLVFLLNINDYGIPSVFGVNVYVLELFSCFSAGDSIYSVFFASLPQLLLCVMIMALFSVYIARSDFSFKGAQGKNPFKKEKFIKIPAILGLLTLAFFAIVPLYNLIHEAAMAKGAIDIIIRAGNELSYSFLVSALAAIFCLIPAIMFAFTFNKSKSRILFLSIVALPFIIPSSITGLSLIDMWNTTFLRFIYQSSIMPAVGMVARFAFIETVVLSIAISRLDRALLDNMRLHYAGLFASLKCIVALIWKECLSAVLIVFALSMGEFGVTLLVTPPGYQTITIKIYNYMHYGASEIVSTLCLFMLIVGLSVAFAVYFLLNGEQNE